MIDQTYKVTPFFFVVKGDNNQEMAEKSKPKLYLSLLEFSSYFQIFYTIWAGFECLAFA